MPARIVQEVADQPPQQRAIATNEQRPAFNRDAVACGFFGR